MKSPPKYIIQFEKIKIVFYIMKSYYDYENILNKTFKSYILKLLLNKQINYLLYVVSSPIESRSMMSNKIYQ